MLVDSPFTEFARTGLGTGLVIGASVVIFTGTPFWVRQRRRPDRGSLVGAGLIGATFIIAPLTSAWRARASGGQPTYSLPVAVLASFFLLIAAMLIWTVVLYRWLWRRRGGPIMGVIGARPMVLYRQHRWSG